MKRTRGSLFQVEFGTFCFDVAPQGKALLRLRIPHLAILFRFLNLGLVTFEEQQKVKRLQRTISESKLAIDSLKRAISELESRLETIEPNSNEKSRRPVLFAVVN